MARYNVRGGALQPVPLRSAYVTYLTQWRLQLAARELTMTARGTADVAADVGYESEAAFNRAFKREFGLPPARYRREAKAKQATKPQVIPSFTPRLRTSS